MFFFGLRLDISPSGMNKAINDDVLRKNKISSLISERFSPDDQSQLAVIKELTLQFECLHHQMQLMSMMVDVTYSAIALLTSSVMLPVGWLIAPFMSYIIPLGFLAKFMGSQLKPELTRQLQDLKNIYQWALADNADVNKALAAPELQKLLKILAQYCDKDFLCRWPSVLNQTQVRSGFFSGWWWQRNQDIPVIAKLKLDAEQGRLHLGYSASIKAAIDFAFSQDFRDTLKIPVPPQVMALLQKLWAGESSQTSNNFLPS